MRIAVISGVTGFVLFVGLALAAWAFSQRDDEILPEIQALLDEVEYGRSSLAYQYLVGLDAPPHLSLEEAGDRVLDWVHDRDAFYEDITAIGAVYTEPHPFDDGTGLPRPEGDLFCSISECGCLARLLDPGLWSPDALDAHDTLHRRYQQLLRASDYRTLSRPDVSEWLPQYGHLVSAARLEQLAAMDLYHRGEIEKAIARAMAHLERLRVWLAMQDQLVGKMVLTALVRDTLIINSAMMRSAGYWQPFSPLTAAERSIRPALARELHGAHRVYQSLDRHPDFFQYSEEGDHVQVPGWLVRAIYKPAMTLNASFGPFQETLDHDRMTLQEFAEAMANRVSAVSSRSWARNAVGSILAEVAASDFSDYLARTMDLSALIALHNQSGPGSDLLSSPETFENPYAPVHPGSYRAAEPDRICAQGPVPESESYRCLPLLPEEV